MNGLLINDNGDTYNITGIGKEKAAKIAYRNLNIHLTPSSNYANARNGSILAAIALYGSTSVELQTVIDAWCAVGVGSSNCTVLEATLSLDSPNGGENWNAGTTELITWTSEGNIEGIDIEYSINEGSSWHTIVDSTSNDGSFEWQIPVGLSTNLAQIRITAANNLTLQDKSNAVFSIEACDVIASFTADTYHICVGESIDFENTSVNMSNFQWAINGTMMASSTDFSHTFNEAGTFIINLAGTEDTGENACGDGFYEIVEVSDGPTAHFNYQINYSNVNFSATNSLQETTYTWDFGNSEIGNSINPTHTYTNSGEYTVCLTATDDCGEAESCQTITVEYDCMVSDSLELVNFYHAMGGDNWTNKDGWLVEPVSEWFGVTLSENGCSVKKLELTIDDETMALNFNWIGFLPDLNLPNLEVLDLSYSRIDCNSIICKAPIPDFSNLPKLLKLRLDRYPLESAIPNFSNLPNLTILNLSGDLTGAIPDFSNLPDLTNLTVGSSESIPDFSNLPNLTNLTVGGSGPIPDFSNLPNLTDLVVSGVSGSIPDFSNLPNLVFLESINNQLTGAIPNFSNLPNLSKLDLYGNQLSGNIPDFSNLPNLTIVNLFDNQLNGTIPNFSNLPNLIHLQLSHNQLNGTIPNFNNSPHLNGIHLADNQLSGAFPDFSNFTNLRFIRADENQLTFEGIIPNINYIASIPDFSYFNYSSQAMIPIYGQGDNTYVSTGDQIYVSVGNELNNTYHWYELGNPTAIQSIVADSTFTIPPNPSAAYYCKVTNSDAPFLTLSSHLIFSDYTPPTSCLTADSLVLVDIFMNTSGLNWTNNSGWLVAPINQWHGVVLSEDNCSVESLTVSGLVGILDDWGLPNLTHLSLSGSLLSGTIPDFSNLPNLTDLRLGGQLSGTIPNFSNLPNLTELNLQRNQLNGTIPNFSNLPNLTELNLSFNQLSGTIPDFSNSSNLTDLDLKSNQLSGTIPSFSNLLNLTVLDLRNNELSEIAPDFSILPSLSDLYLNGNQLSGTVPDFSNFPNLNFLFLGGNNFNFDGLEQNVNNDFYYSYSPQAPLPTHQLNNQLYVSAGGTLVNNTYTWYEVGNPNPISTITADSTFTLSVTDIGKTYYCGVNNSIVTDLTLVSDTYTVLSLTTECLLADSLELVNFYCATGGDNWTDNSGWLMEPVSEWFGVTLSEGGCSVEKLELFINNSTGNNLVGTLPDLNLPNLEVLDLKRNKLYGSIPDFSNLPKLTILDLNFNYQLSGNISNFDSLPNLTFIDLSLVNISDYIYDFSNFSNLTHLYLSSTNLNGSIPDFSNLQKLKFLGLSNNQLNGEIPNFSNLPELTHLYLSGNRLSGEIPDFSNLPNLTLLSLSINKLLSGEIPNFSNLPNLATLNLYDNQLNGEIPNFSNLPNLTSLQLSKNQLSGEIPNFSNLPNLTSLKLSKNQLSGEIPDLGSLYQLSGFHINDNNLTFEGLVTNFYSLPNTYMSYHTQGLIPIHQEAESLYVSAGGNIENNTYWWYELGSSIAVDTIEADSTFTLPNNSNASYYCKVTNSIATELTLTSEIAPSNYIPPTNCLTTDSLVLVEFFLNTEGHRWSNNNGWLTAPIDEWFGVSVSNCGIDSLSLRNNNLIGILPDFNLPNLEYLELSSNQLSGSIPNFSNLPNLTYLSLSSNQLNGNIPDFANLSNLFFMLLGQNQLSGTIPNFSNLPNLTNLNLYNNNLNETIPNFGNLPKLTYLNLSNNRLNETIPNFDNLPDLTSLSLNYNQLSGNIPNFNKLPNLTYLDLSNIRISGNIPDFSNSPNLTHLELQWNQLSGGIPDFSNLPNLTHLWLNNNQLSGNIPNFSNLPDLSWLTLNDNQLSGNIPNFTNLSNLSRLYLENNNLVFEGLEQNVAYFNSSSTFNTFKYSPQSTIPTYQLNNQLYVSTGGTYENNTYTWYELGNPTPIPEANDSIFTIPNFSKNYYCEITNSIATDLILKSDIKPTPLSLDCSPTASFDIPIVCEDIPAIFTNTSTDATTFQWQINGINYSTNSTFVYTFLEAGNYILQLIATDDVFCSDTLTQNVLVHQNAESIDLDIGEDKELCANQVLLSANISGMAAYNWQLSGAQVGNGLTHSADTTGNYVLQITDYCGNQQTDTIFVLLDDSCVWAGDYNYDGIANVYDLLPYGIHFGATGPTRPNASLNWTPQPSLDWEGIQENGNNLKHIDGNGNGLIEGMDTTAILQNYGKTHGTLQDTTLDNSIVLSLTPSTPDTYGLSDNTSIVTYSVELSQQDGGMVTAYGLAFTLEYDLDSAVIESVHIDASNSWLGIINTNMNALMHHNPDDGTIDIGLTRINHQNKTGVGTAIDVIFTVDNFASNDTLTFATKNVQISLSNGNLMGINSLSDNFSFTTPDCMDEVSITYTTLDNIPTITQGFETIQIGNSDDNGTVVFPDGKRTYLQAEQSISLKTGTDIQEGSVLDASIGDCETEEDTESGKAAIGGKSNDTVFDLQIFPNPFSDRTKIDYFLPVDSPVTLTIYDIHGRVVKKLLQNKSQKAGSYGLQFTPCNMAQGIYLCKIEAGEWQKTVRLVKSN